MKKPDDCRPPCLTRVVTHEQVSDAVRNDRLLSLSLKLPGGCNLKCLYCYSDMKRGDLAYDEIRDILSQAYRLGVRSLSVIGDGEPFLYQDKGSGKDIFSLIKDANAIGMSVIVFTNNTLIDQKTAARLYDFDVAIVCKLNSAHKKTQDFLAGVDGAFSKIIRGLVHLENAGFAKKTPSRLSIHTIICRQNASEIFRLWHWCRQRNIIPYFQVMVPPRNQNRARNEEMRISSAKAKEMFAALAQIDRTEYGYLWDPDYTYPIAGLGCSVVKTGCCVNSNAKVQICGYLQEEIGDLRQQGLADILRSTFVQKIRRFAYGQGEVNHRHFYGCRALTFNMSDDRFAPDPFFWKGV